MLKECERGCCSTNAVPLNLQNRVKGLEAMHEAALAT